MYKHIKNYPSNERIVTSDALGPKIYKVTIYAC